MWHQWFYWKKNQVYFWIKQRSYGYFSLVLPKSSESAVIAMMRFKNKSCAIKNGFFIIFVYLFTMKCVENSELTKSKSISQLIWQINRLREVCTALLIKLNPDLTCGEVVGVLTFYCSISSSKMVSIPQKHPNLFLLVNVVWSCNALCIQIRE